MKITQIQVRGDAGHFADVFRPHGSDAIRVEYTFADGRQSRAKWRADNVDELRIAAQHMQETLDGQRGSNADVLEYRRILETFEG